MDYEQFQFNDFGWRLIGRLYECYMRKKGDISHSEHYGFEIQGVFNYKGRVKFHQAATMTFNKVSLSWVSTNVKVSRDIFDISNGEMYFGPWINTYGDIYWTAGQDHDVFCVVYHPQIISFGAPLRENDLQNFLNQFQIPV